MLQMSLEIFVLGNIMLKYETNSLSRGMKSMPKSELYVYYEVIRGKTQVKKIS